MGFYEAALLYDIEAVCLYCFSLHFVDWFHDYLDKCITFFI